MSLTTRITQLAQAIAGDVKTLVSGLSGKVDKVTGFGLSSNDYTITDKTKLANLTAAGITPVAIPAGGAVDLSTTTTNVVTLSGNIPINSLGTMPEGVTRILQFQQAGFSRLMVNGPSIVIPGGLDFLCLPNSIVVVCSQGSGVWKVISGVHADGTPIVGFAGGTLTSALGEAPPVGLVADTGGQLGYNTLANTVLVTHASGTGGVISSMATPPTTGVRRLLVFQGAYALTPSATFLVPGNAAITTAAGDTVEAVYLGSSVWRLFNYQHSGSPSSGSVSLVEVQATSASQATFTIPGGYVIGPASPVVWLAGALLEKSEYTATDGSTVTLSTPSTSLADKMTVMSINSLSMLATTMVGASASAAGVKGLVPAPSAGDQVKFLRGDGTYATPGSSIGDVLYTTATTPPANYVLPGTLYAQSAYPELFALIGNIEANVELATRTVITPFAAATQSYQNGIATGLSKVIVAVGNVTSTGLSIGRRSTDGGVTWSTIASLTGLPALANIATDGAGVWCVTSPGSARIYRSTDNGLTFTAIVPSPFVTCRAIDTDRKGVWLASSDAQTAIYRSTDNGLTWASAGTSIGAQAIDILTSDGVSAWFTISYLYAGVGASYDNGTTWVQSASIATQVATLCSGQGMTLTAGAAVCSILTVDAGANWKPFSMDGLRAGMFSYAISPEGTVIEYSNPYLRISTDRGDTWTASRATSYGVMSLLARTFDSDGNCLAKSVNSTADSAVYYRLVRGYSYSTSTQFKTPTLKVPTGYRAYIKAKS